MSRTMEEVFDQVARECGWECWFTAYNEEAITNMMIAEAASRYAELQTQKHKELLMQVVYEYEQGERSYGTIRDIKELLDKQP